MSRIDTDTIDVCRKKKGSIKITRIDGHLYDKSMYDGSKWIGLCRYNSCESHIDSHELCLKHYIENTKMYKPNMIIEISGSRYKWNLKEWILLCSLCDKPAFSNVGGYCSMHKKNSNIIYSSRYNIINLYNSLKKELQEM